MQSKSQDLRVTKTLMALSSTLMELLEKKSFKKITVNDICQGALVSRSTFYMHFEDKYQLMLFCLQTEKQRLDEVKQCIEPSDYLHTVLTSIYKRKKVFNNFHHAEMDMELINMFNNFFHEYFSDILKTSEQQGIKLPGSIPILAAYYTSGLTGMLMWWIKHNFSVPIDEMASCQYNLLSNILPDKGLT